MKKNNVAFVLGMFETGLGVIRSLGRNNIFVCGLDYKKDIAYYSKFVNPIICPHPRDNGFIDFLLTKGSLHKSKPILYITADEYLLPIIKNKEIIEKYFLLNAPSFELLENIENKYAQYALAVRSDVPVPKTIVLESYADFENVIDNFSFPIFLKGVDSTDWRKIYGGSLKGFKFETPSDLSKSAATLLAKNVKIIAQEFLAGPETNHFKFNCYIGNDGKLKAGFCLRKIRQHPIHFGVGSMVESIKDDRLFEIGKKLFLNIKYRGVGSAEFKFNEKDNQYKLIEINPRYWQQNYLATYCGINFPLIQYLDLTEQVVPEILEYKDGIKWVNIYSDFDSFLAYRRENSLTFLDWLQSLKGEKVFSDWSKDDMLPGLYEIRFGKRLIKLPLYLMRKLLK